MTVTWTDTANPQEHLLTGATVDDSCHKLWVRLWFNTQKLGILPIPYIWVQAGAVHTLDQATLQEFGLYQQPFFRWSIHVGWEGQRHLLPDCSDPRADHGFILADGSILSCA